MYRGFSAHKKRERASIPQIAFKNEIYSLERGPLLFVVCNTKLQLRKPDKILSLGDGRVCHSSSNSQSNDHIAFKFKVSVVMQTSPSPFCPISLPIINFIYCQLKQVVLNDTGRSKEYIMECLSSQN